MANMSYCRFENTLGDLSDCFGALQDMLDEAMDNTDINDLSQLVSGSELTALWRLANLCESFVECYSELYDEVTSRKP